MVGVFDEKVKEPTRSTLSKALRSVKSLETWGKAGIAALAKIASSDAPCLAGDHR
jgi:hypothetical protein